MRAILLSILALAACSADPAWDQLDSAKLTKAQKSQLTKAEASRDELAGQLKARLMGAMKSGGPVTAIEACRVSAPEITGEIDGTLGLRIGRSSHKLRNPKNIAPSWAAAHVAAAKMEPAFFAGPKGRIGALYPIPLAKPCSVCHGDSETIPEGVKSALKAHYPQDQATGFAVGALRGWFWVEVP